MMDKLKRRRFLQMCVAAVTAPTVIQTLSKASVGPVTELEVSKEAVAVLQPDPHETYIFMYKGFCFSRDWHIGKQCYFLYLRVGRYNVANLIYSEDWDMLWERCCDNMIRATERRFGYKHGNQKNWVETL